MFRTVKILQTCNIIFLCRIFNKYKKKLKLKFLWKDITKKIIRVWFYELTSLIFYSFRLCFLHFSLSEIIIIRSGLPGASTLKILKQKPSPREHLSPSCHMLNDVSNTMLKGNVACRSLVDAINAPPSRHSSHAQLFVCCCDREEISN